MSLTLTRPPPSSFIIFLWPQYSPELLKALARLIFVEHFVVERFSVNLIFPCPIVYMIVATVAALENSHYTGQRDETRNKNDTHLSSFLSARSCNVRPAGVAKLQQLWIVKWSDASFANGCSPDEHLWQDFLDYFV